MSVTNGNLGFCSCQSCSENEGDCDSNNECLDGLVCGLNNCPASLGHDSEVDCCYEAIVGTEDFCSYSEPCETDEGDCDSDDECEFDLSCGSNNCPTSLGFGSEVNCCFPCPDTCGSPSYKDDQYCDDENNNCGCEWDGGDCCGINVNTKYCSACECLDPNADPANDSSTNLAPTSTTIISTDGCEHANLIGDNACDDGNNFEHCLWDGGDCCGSNVNTDYCSACECLDPTTIFDIDYCFYPSFFRDDSCDDANNNEHCLWDGGDCCGRDVNTNWCTECECLDPNCGNISDC